MGLCYCALCFECLNMARLGTIPLALACALEVRYPTYKRGISAVLAQCHVKTRQKACVLRIPSERYPYPPISEDLYLNVTSLALSLSIFWEIIKYSYLGDPFTLYGKLVLVCQREPDMH